jgi:hypothetical protein
MSAKPSGHSPFLKDAIRMFWVLLNKIIYLKCTNFEEQPGELRRGYRDM